ncbi:hypothetical protein L596_003419 [Steinernema carpocapsae]|uniref:Uncharacterized protein n=1 Tax=Steinernema carpocapsae TaxID=34508 RepID=A0A4U8UWH9_STECR|nr:hypothetical protein L596_003419 [Steinernema carpocapsae]
MSSLFAVKCCEIMTVMRCATVLYLLSYAAQFKTEAYTLQHRQSTQDIGPKMMDERVYFRQKMSIPWAEDPSCPIHNNEALHAVLDRVCLMCHEMFSHEQPNMRAECRKDCFNNNKFRNCLSIFAPQRPEKSRKSMERI